MSDDEFHAYIALLVFSALVLSVVAIRGFGQSTGARIVDGVFSVAFLGYAGYLMVAAPGTVLVSYYAFVVPVLAVIHSARPGRARRTAEPVNGFGHPTGYNIDPVPALPPATLAYIERLGGVPIALGQPADLPAADDPPAQVVAEDAGPALLSPQPPVLQTASPQAASAAPPQPATGQRGAGRHRRADP